MNTPNWFASLLLLLLLGNLGCRDDIRQTPALSPEQLEIQEFLVDYYQTMSDRDWPAYQAFFSKDATLSTVWAQSGDSVPQITTFTITQFLAQTKDGPDSQPIFEERMESSEIEVKPGIASAWVHYRAKFGSEGQLMEWEGDDLFSLIQYQGHWKIVSLTYRSE